MLDLNVLSKLSVIGVSSVSMSSFESWWVSDITRHNNHGIAFVVEGEIEFSHGGNKYICGKNNVIFIPGNTTYRYATPKTAKIAIINFFLTERSGFSEFQIASVDNLDSFLVDHAVLCKIITSASLTAHTEFLSVFYKMLTRLINTIGMNQGFNSTWHITEYINANLNSPDLTVSSIAQAAGFSEVHFRKLFKSYYGISPKQYVQNLRIEKAKRMLQSSNESISKIAVECGFSTIFYFSKLYKDKTGYSPYEYRERYRKLF